MIPNDLIRALAMWIAFFLASAMGLNQATSPGALHPIFQTATAIADGAEPLDPNGTPMTDILPGDVFVNATNFARNQTQTPGYNAATAIAQTATAYATSIPSPTRTTIPLATTTTTPESLEQISPTPEISLATPVPAFVLYEVVANPRLYIRSGPGTNFTRVGSYNKGAKLQAQCGNTEDASGYTWCLISPGRYVAKSYRGTDYLIPAN